MADKKIDIKTLGHSGVVIDPNPLEPGLPDDSLRSAQNATHDPTQEYGGALRKRAGLKRFNNAYAGGPILGGMPLAVVGTGGAPASGGGGDTGGGDGGGDGTGAPGGTTGGGGAIYTPPGAAGFGGGSLFSGARLIIVGRADNTIPNQYGHGWYVTSKKFANMANLVTTPGPPCVSGGQFGSPAGTGNMGLPSVITTDGFLYYIKTHDETATTVPMQIRKTNGAVDTAVVTIPVHANTTAYAGTGNKAPSVTAMVLDSATGNIYVLVVDKNAAGTTSKLGRIFKLTTLTGALTEMNTGVPAVTPGDYADIPYCGAKFEGKFFWGTFPNVQDASATINVLSSDEKYGSQDYNGGDQRFANITCLLSSGGILYASTQDRTAGVVQRSQVIIRQPHAGIGAAGNWLPLDIDIVGGDTLVDKNYYPSMVEFGGYIYISWYNPTQVSRIYKATPNANVGGFQSLSPITLSFASSSAGERVPYTLFVDDGVLYACGNLGPGGNVNMIWTTDGTTWTSGTANFPTTNQSYPLSVFFGVSQ